MVSQCVLGSIALHRASATVVIIVWCIAFLQSLVIPDPDWNDPLYGPLPFVFSGSMMRFVAAVFSAVTILGGLLLVTGYQMGRWFITPAGFLTATATLFGGPSLFEVGYFGVFVWALVALIAVVHFVGILGGVATPIYSSATFTETPE